MPLLPSRSSQTEVEEVAHDYQYDNGGMRGRLRVHSGHGTSFLADQAFVFSRAREVHRSSH